MKQLFCDCKTDEEKANFFLSGRAVETGIIAPAISNDVAMAYHRCAEFKKETDALRAELAQLHKEADKFGDGIDWVQRALQAEAQIEAMEQQEPVGVIHVGSCYGEELQDWEFEADQRVCDRLNERHVTNPTSLKLYALPGAQPAPSVPDDILYRLGAAHDACLDGDHRACRDTITQLMCDIGPDGAVPEPEANRDAP